MFEGEFVSVFVQILRANGAMDVKIHSFLISVMSGRSIAPVYPDVVTV
jgi:hypothetical protein